MRKRTTVMLAMSVVAAMGVSACGSSSSAGNNDKTGSSAKTVQGASVTLTINGEPTTLDPQAREDGNLADVDGNIFESLLIRSADGSKLEPWLATALPKNINPTTWQFQLRQGVKFSDGEPFNAASAVYSINRILDPTFNSDWLSNVDTITSAKAEGDYTLDVVTKAPDPLLPARMYLISMMAPNAKNPASNPIGTGPYVLKDWSKGDHITLAANPDYWGKKPSITKVTFNYPTESGTRLAQLLSGQTDLVTNLLPTDASKAPQLLDIPGQNESMMILNARAGVTANQQVRQAMNYAIDTAKLGETLYEGHASPENCQIMNKNWFGYNPALKPYPYDQSKAKQLIKDAGATGKTVTMVADASGRWPGDRDLAQAVAQAWRDIGLKVDVKLMQFNDYLDALFHQPDRADAIILYSNNVLFDADRTVTAYIADGGNGTSNSNPQIAQLAKAARSELDTTKRQGMYDQIMQTACDQAYFWFGLQVDDLYGASKKLHWTPRADQYMYVVDMSVS